MRCRRFLLVAIFLGVLITGAASIAFHYGVYPGPQVLTVYLPSGGTGQYSRPAIVGQVVSFSSERANLLHISVSTIGSSYLYVLNSSQVQEYLLAYANYTNQVVQYVLNHTTPSLISSVNATSYPTSFMYESQPSQQHSYYLQVQKQASYYLVELSIPSQTSLSFPSSGAIQGYASTQL